VKRRPFLWSWLIAPLSALRGQANGKLRFERIVRMTRYVRNGPVVLDLDQFPAGPTRQFADAVAAGEIDRALMLAKGLPEGINTASPDGITALLIAVVRLRPDDVAALLRAGANPNGAAGNAPLYTAVMADDLTIARMLLQAGADPNGRAGGETALYNAVLLNQRGAVDLLLAYKADINARNSLGEPITEAAADTNNWELVLYLLDRGASLWATDDVGGTLGLSAKFSHVAPDSAQGRALADVIERLKRAGFPWPPPSPKEVVALRAEKKWPPPGASR
jgi:hypothetical protein